MGLKRSKDGTADPMQVVSRFLDAANHHDADALRACVHHDFESIQPIHPGRNFRGSGQLVSNWKAIFEAEPGFRLTVLRSAVEDNTVWVEVHGAGDSAEAAGIFIVGVEDGRIRWIRVYSDLVEPAPEVAPTEVAPAPAAVVGPAEEGALEPAAVADGDGAVDAPETPPAADDEPAAAVGDGDGAQEGRPLRLVEAADAELEADDADDAGAATSLRLVGDEEPDGGDAPADLEGVETAELLDVPTDETEEADEADETAHGEEIDAGGPMAPEDAIDADDDAASHPEQSSDEATTETESAGGVDGADRAAETAVEPPDGDASEPEAEEVDAAFVATTDATADGEVVDTPSDDADVAAETPSGQADTDAAADAAAVDAQSDAAAVDAPSEQAHADATADGEVVDTPPGGTDANAAADAIADGSPPDEADAAIVETTSPDAETSTEEVGGNGEGDAEGDVDTSGDGASATAAEVVGDTDVDHDVFAGDRPGDLGVTPGAGEPGSEPPDSSSSRGALEVVEPTSPPLPRATGPRSSSAEEEQRSWRRVWRRKRGFTGG